MEDVASSLFTDENKASSSAFWKPEKVGDRVYGYLISREQRPNRLQPGVDQVVYTLHQLDETLIQVSGRMKLKNKMGAMVARFPQLDHAKLGQLVGIEYIGTKEAKQAGYNPTKLMEVYLKDDFRPDLVPASVDAPPMGMGSDIPFN